MQHIIWVFTFLQPSCNLPRWGSKMWAEMWNQKHPSRWNFLCACCFCHHQRLGKLNIVVNQSKDVLRGRRVFKTTQRWFMTDVVKDTWLKNPQRIIVVQRVKKHQTFGTHKGLLVSSPPKKDSDVLLWANTCLWCCQTMMALKKVLWADAGIIFLVSSLGLLHHKSTSTDFYVSSNFTNASKFPELFHRHRTKQGV